MTTIFGYDGDSEVVQFDDLRLGRKMSLRSSFAIHKTKPRKTASRSILKLNAEELARELGPRYQVVDARIGNQKMTYDIAKGEWIAGRVFFFLLTFRHVFFLLNLDGTIGSPISTREMTKLEKTKRELEEDNNTLRTKLDSLLEMLAEVTAEYELRRGA